MGGGGGGGEGGELKRKKKEQYSTSTSSTELKNGHSGGGHLRRLLICPFLIGRSELIFWVPGPLRPGRPDRQREGKKLIKVKYGTGEAIRFKGRSLR